MFEFLRRMFGSERSKDVAKQRLQLVLVHDRASVSPDVIDQIKEEIIEVISNHIDIDEEGTEILLDRDDQSVALVANIPLVQLQRTGEPGHYKS